MADVIFAGTKLLFKICRKRLTEFASVIKYIKRVFYADARGKLYGG